MTTLRLFLLAILFVQIASAQSTFKTPSEAYRYALEPGADWNSDFVLKSTEREVRKRSEPLCRNFSVDCQSGEELYWLAKLCKWDGPKAILALERYFATSDPQNGPDARILFVDLELGVTRTWESSWPTLKTILQEDSMTPVESLSETAIEEEAEDNIPLALDWARERYTILLARNKTPKAGTAPIPLQYALNAGCDLVLLENQVGKTSDAEKDLTVINNLQKSTTESIRPWTLQKVTWANLEMTAAPEIPVSKILGSLPSSGIFQPGRVEVISFFFLACSPCMEELPGLEALQKRVDTKDLLVADITTYKANDASSPSHTELERAMESTRSQKAPHVPMVITPDATTAAFGVTGFPTTFVVDKTGKIRWVGHELHYGSDDPVGKLVARLIAE